MTYSKTRTSSGKTAARLFGKLEKLEGDYSLERLQQMAREKGVSPTGTKRDILVRLFVEHGEKWEPRSVPQIENNLLGRYHRPLPDEAY